MKASTEAPTEGPAKAPTEGPAKAPTEGPAKAPTEGPAKAPTDAPAKAPTEAPPKSLTKAPTEALAKAPTMAGLRALALAVGLLALAACGQKAATAPATPPATSGAAPAPALLTTPPPWPAPTAGEGALVSKAQLPLLPKEALDEHIHAHLDVFYDGQPVTVPAYIGIVLDPIGISPLHTHDTTGIVHVESATVRPFYLGQFFTEWGVQMGSGCVAGQCPPGRPVAVFVNGAPVQGPAEGVEITAHAEIVVAVGTPPASIPTSFRFPSGY